jgi:hypothetical protein
VKTYGDVISEYELHPEAKCADFDGNVCGKPTIGLLQRRHLQIELIKLVGKESNSLENVDAGTVHSAEQVYTEYSDRRRDQWQTRIVPALSKLSTSVLTKETGLSRRMIIKARQGKVRPHASNQALLISVLRKLTVI